MEKKLEFSQEQKSLIWSRFVAPTGGTQEETEHFIEVCETFGLNPLLGDIVFQRFNTKNGPKTQFITTRDGLLRVATGQPGYVGAPNANVVKEGDEFEFIPSEGKVFHKFGEKRGNILGAYAVMQHATYNPVAVFVDFNEYFNANSGVKRNGYPNVWDQMPSAMIQKIAEVFVLRRQFPLGGLYTQEEMLIENGEINQGQNPVQPVQQNNKQTGKVKQEQNVKNPASILLSNEQVEELSQIASEISQLTGTPADQVLNALGKPLSEFTQSEFIDVKGKLLEWLGKTKKQVTSINQKNVDGEQNKSTEINKPTSGSQTYTLLKREEGNAPDGSPYVLVYTKEKPEIRYFVRNEKAIEAVRQIPENATFQASVVEENGFYFIESVENILESVV